MLKKWKPSNPTSLRLRTNNYINTTKFSDNQVRLADIQDHLQENTAYLKNTLNL